MNWLSVDQITNFVGSSQFQTVLYAVAILIGGWIIAAILATLIARVLEETGLGKFLGRWVFGPDRDISSLLSRVLYYLTLVFTIIEALSILNLGDLANPLRTFVFQLINAGLLLLVAAVLAHIVKAIVSKGVDGMNFAKLTDKGTQHQISHSIGEMLYWLIFLLFLPLVLGALDLQGLLGPVENMLDKILSFLPNIFAGVIILVVGWFVARLLQKVVFSLLKSTGVDGVGTKAGLSGINISSLVSQVVFALVIVPTLVSALNTLNIPAVTGPASDMLGKILSAIPNILTAAIVVAVAYFVSVVVERVVGDVLSAANFDKLTSKIGLPDTLTGKYSASHAVGKLVMIVIMIFSVIEAAELLQFEVLSDLLAQFLTFGGQVIVGIIIIMIGLFFANIAAHAIESSKMKHSHLMALVARVAILIITVTMGLTQMGVATDIINTAFTLILGALAVAGAIAFGWGGRDVAARKLEQWWK